MRPVRARLSIALICVLIAGCGGAPTAVPSAAPSLGPTAEPSPTPTPSPATTPAPSSSRTAEPTPVPTPTLPPAGRWVRVDDQPAFASASMNAVAAGPGGFVAVGMECLGTYPACAVRAVAWTSPDGLAWDRADLPSRAEERADLVVYDGADYVASVRAGPVAVLWTSSDGAAWRRMPDVPAFAGAEIRGMARIGDRRVAVGLSGTGFALWTSTDGLSWESVGGMPKLEETDDNSGLGVVAFGDRFVAWATSWADDYVLTSTDGLHWSTTRHALRAVAGRTIGAWISDVAVDGDRLVAVGGRECTKAEWGEITGGCTYGAAWTSTDSVTWRPAKLRGDKQQSQLGLGFETVVRRGDRIVAIARQFGALTASWESPDGGVWTQSASAPGGGWVDPAPEELESWVLGIAAGSDRTVAVGGFDWLDEDGHRWLAAVWMLR